jgi:uncharacterized protein YbaA (DUF1428 family)
MKDLLGPRDDAETPLSPEEREKFLNDLHRRMYGHVWRWAGQYRRSDKNIGVDWSLGDDVPHGQLTSFTRAVQLAEDEVVIFSWAVFPSREARDAANQKIMHDPRLKGCETDPPFDGKRLVFGGFVPFTGLE